MKKKAQAPARLPKRVPKPINTPRPSGKIGVSAEESAPSSAWLEMMQQVAAEPTEQKVVRREAGPGMPQYREPSTSPQIVLIPDGVCDGCLEKITQPKDHEWWCPWWDTTEGKRAVPF